MTDFVRDANKNRLEVGDKIRVNGRLMAVIDANCELIPNMFIIKHALCDKNGWHPSGVLRYGDPEYIEFISNATFLTDREYDEAVVLLKLTS